MILGEKTNIYVYCPGIKIQKLAEIYIYPSEKSIIHKVSTFKKNPAILRKQGLIKFGGDILSRG